MHGVSNPIITVQGHPGSKFIMPIESLLMVCYLTSFKSNNVSVSIFDFEIFAAKIPDPDLGRFKVSEGSWCQSIAHYSTSVDTIVASVTIFAIFHMRHWWLWSRPVQGHPESKYIEPIESPLVGSHLTSFESNVVSVFILEIFDKNVLWPRSRTVQGHLKLKITLSIEWIDSP